MILLRSTIEKITYLSATGRDDRRGSVGERAIDKRRESACDDDDNIVVVVVVIAAAVTT
jgi:hypothetical protein